MRYAHRGFLIPHGIVKTLGFIMIKLNSMNFLGIFPSNCVCQLIDHVVSFCQLATNCLSATTHGMSNTYDPKAISTKKNIKMKKAQYCV